MVFAHNSGTSIVQYPHIPFPDMMMLLVSLEYGRDRIYGTMLLLQQAKGLGRRMEVA
jgi:hypothetical protein